MAVPSWFMTGAKPPFRALKVPPSRNALEGPQVTPSATSTAGRVIETAVTTPPGTVKSSVTKLLLGTSRPTMDVKGGLPVCERPGLTIGSIPSASAKLADVASNTRRHIAFTSFIAHPRVVQARNHRAPKWPNQIRRTFRKPFIFMIKIAPSYQVRGSVCNLLQFS